MSDQEAYLKNMARDIQSIKSMMTEVINYMKEAEVEVSEKMRRFVMYMHDVHDMSHLYEERGLPVPAYILRELERCDDRYRHLLEDTDHFEKIRMEMSKRAGNRWDHTRQLEKPHETGNVKVEQERPESGTEVKGGEPGGSGGNRDSTGQDPTHENRRPRL